MKADADAGRDEQLALVNVERDAQRLGDLLRDLGGVFDVLDVRNEQREFVAAESRHRVPFAHASANAFGERFEQMIADRVAEGVVDVFEPIEIEEKDGQALLRARRLRDAHDQSIDEERTIRQSGERIVIREMFDLGAGQLRRFAFVFEQTGDHADGDDRLQQEVDVRKRCEEVVGQFAGDEPLEAESDVVNLLERAEEERHTKDGEADTFASRARAP